MLSQIFIAFGAVQLLSCTADHVGCGCGCVAWIMREEGGVWSVMFLSSVCGVFSAEEVEPEVDRVAYLRRALNEARGERDEYMERLACVEGC